MDNNNTTDGQRKPTANREHNTKTKMRLDEKISSVAFGRSTKIDSDKNVPRIRICVLGFASVGKTGKIRLPLIRHLQGVSLCFSSFFNKENTTQTLHPVSNVQTNQSCFSVGLRTVGDSIRDSELHGNKRNDSNLSHPCYPLCIACAYDNVLFTWLERSIFHTNLCSTWPVNKIATLIGIYSISRSFFFAAVVVRYLTNRFIGEYCSGKGIRSPICLPITSKRLTRMKHTGKTKKNTRIERRIRSLG